MITPEQFEHKTIANKVHEAKALALTKKADDIFRKYQNSSEYWLFHLHVFEKIHASSRGTDQNKTIDDKRGISRLRASSKIDLANEVVALVRNEGISENQVPDVFARIFERIDEEAYDQSAAAIQENRSQRTDMTPVSLGWYLEKLIANKKYDVAKKLLATMEEVRFTSSKRRGKGTAAIKPSPNQLPDAQPTTSDLHLFRETPDGDLKCAIRFARRVLVSSRELDLLQMVAGAFIPNEPITCVPLSMAVAKFGWQEAWRLAKKDREEMHKFTRNKVGPLIYPLQDRLVAAGIREARIGVDTKAKLIEFDLPGVQSIHQEQQHISREPSPDRR
jgi:hypothetical protein